MKKSFLFLTLFLVFNFLPAYAGKIPVRIAPTQIISTHHDETEVGDWINFEVVTDVYKDGNLYIKKGTRVIGVVDFVHPNGWMADSADVKIKNFSTIDINNQKVEIIYPTNINGNKLIDKDVKLYLSYVFFTLFRGSEIFLEPDSKIFNIFINQ